MDIQLRNVIDSDLPLFFEQQADPEASQMAAFPSRDWDPFLAHWKKILADETNIIKTIIFQGQVAGNIVSFLMVDRREVGYWLGRGFWGKGIATQALEEFLQEVKIRPLYGVAAKHNIGSKRVLEKCGFRPYSQEAEEDFFILE